MGGSMVKLNSIIRMPRIFSMTDSRISKSVGSGSEEGQADLEQPLNIADAGFIY